MKKAYIDKVGIEPVIFIVDELFPITSYFLYNILDYGKDVFSVKKEEVKKAERMNLVNLATEYLESAEDALEEGHIRLAVDAAYNSAELCVKSIILKSEDDIPGSHGDVVGKFGELYIKTGKIEKSIGKRLNRALELRNNARDKYQAIIKKDEAQEVIELARIIGELAQKEEFYELRIKGV